MDDYEALTADPTAAAPTLTDEIRILLAGRDLAADDVADATALRRLAEEVAAEWRVRVWGTASQGVEYVVLVEHAAYVITDGTGEGVYAYCLWDVVDWLDGDGAPGEAYADFTQRVLPVEDADVARVVLDEHGLRICAAGTGEPVVTLARVDDVCITCGVQFDDDDGVDRCP